MGFNKVYKVLLEIFPEVDSRVLRAVAIEHRKDADFAVEVVLTEAIPYLTERSTYSSSSSEISGVPQPPEAAEVFADGSSVVYDGIVESLRCPEEEQHGPFYDAKDDSNQIFDDTDDMNLNSRPEKVTSVRNCDERIETGADMPSSVSSVVSGHENGVNVDNVNGVIITGDQASEMSQGSSIKVVSDEISLEHENLGNHQSLDSCLLADSNNCKSCETNISVGNSVGLLSQSNLEPLKLTSPESMVQLADKPDTQNTDLGKEINGHGATNTESFGEMADVEDEPMLNTKMTGSSQAFSIDLLEDIIGDARNNKKILLSSVETIISLMKEVELQEKAAEQAKQDVANGGLEILERVEDLKQMLRHAKEANEMHAGEVYGEKAILATEVRELQSRLLCLSDERDKSLGILDEMRRNLEMRLAAAEKERKMAEEEKLEREDIARKALKDQEVIMEKVVQEANILKQEAEENAKLQEFLMDRGRVVDALQGEISVICTDVRLLKVKFDEHLPLSESLTSSQTSCIVASSSSSSKSMTCEQVDRVPEHDSSEIPKTTDLMLSCNEPEFVREETAADDRKELADEEWEIFDNRDAYM